MRIASRAIFLKEHLQLPQVLTKQFSSMAKYSKAAEKKIAKVMREKKRGTLKMGRSGKKVTSRKQAIAIGISEARASGMKVPRQPAKKTGRKPAKRGRTMARRRKVKR
jgi:hypothetical protein